MSDEVKYTIQCFLRKDSKRGKYHLVPANTKVAVCSAKLSRPVSGMYSQPIEKAYRMLLWREKRHRSRSWKACKTCLKRAQKLRNPLDRLADIDSSGTEGH